MKKIKDLTFKDQILGDIKNVFVDGIKYKVKGRSWWMTDTIFTLCDYSDRPKKHDVSIEEFVEYYVDSTFVNSNKVIAISSESDPKKLERSGDFFIISKKITNLNEEEKIKRLILNLSIDQLLNSQYLYTINLYSGEVERIYQYDEFIAPMIPMIKNYKSDRVPAGILRYYMHIQNEKIITIPGKFFKSNTQMEGLERIPEYNIWTFNTSNNNIDGLIELLFYHSLTGNINSDNIIYYTLNSGKIEGNILNENV